jgi:hypothetical protein
MPAKPNTRSSRNGIGLWLLVTAAVVVAIVVFAPAAVGRLLGGLWVTVMGAVTGLVGGVLS